MTTSYEILNRIPQLDKNLENHIYAHLDNLTKPPGSLGQLEELALNWALLQKTTKPAMPKKRIYVFAADHGIAEEKVSAYPQEVTTQMVENMAKGGAAINVLARHAGAELKIVDVGVNADLCHLKNILHHKISYGTANMTKGPAMSPENSDKAMNVGIKLANEAYEEGITLLGIGEMGIGNTSSAAAIMHLLLPCNLDAVVGCGTGLDKEGIERKIKAINKAIKVNSVDCTLPYEVLDSLGGLEIAAMMGMMIGAADKGIPVVIDGFIASSAALVAMKDNPYIRDYLFFSHCSAEKGHKVFYEQACLDPLFDFGMRLGEGTGAALFMTILDASIKIYNEMSTFSSAGVSQE